MSIYKVIAVETDDSWVLGTIVVLALWGLFYLIHGILISWASYSPPIREIVHYYNYLIMTPFDWSGTAFEWVKAAIHKYPNLAEILAGVTAVVTFVVTALLEFFCLVLISLVLRRGDKKAAPGTALMLFVVPAIFGILWLAGSGILHWLFSTTA